MNRRTLTIAAAAAVLVGGALAGLCQQNERHLGYTDTPYLPGGKWRVHDGTRPQPKVVDPGTASTQDQPGRAPSDAVVLFDGKDTSKWRKDDGQALPWKVDGGAMVAGGGSAVSKDEFGDCQIHVEWAAPNPPRGGDQGRGNSGVIIMGRYEIQVLDCYDNLTYPDGTTAAIYGQYPPLVNACRKPGEWQTYDILWEAPRFEGDRLVKPAYVTVLHNGIVVHNHTEVIGAVAFRALAKYSPHGPKGPIVLQDHGNPVRYRNIWVRELKAYDQP